MSNELLPQPFLDGLKNPPEKKKEVAKIRTWMQSQLHLPTISDEFIVLFLHACYYSIDKTKNCIESYFSIRSNNPSIFGDRDLNLPSIQTMLSLACMAKVPELTPEGYRILIYRIADTDYRKLVFSEGVKTFCMVNDVILSEDGLVEGYVIIFDMKGLQLAHLARVSLPALRVFMNYIQDAHPVRLKAIHVLHTASFMNHVMRLLVPLARSDIMSMLRFHPGNVAEGIPQHLLPSDYGGQAPDTADLHRVQFEMMMKRYPEWLKQSAQLKVDESKRPKKTSWLGLFSGGNAEKKDVGFKTVAEID